MSNLQTVTTDSGTGPLYETRAPVNENPRLNKLSETMMIDHFLAQPYYRTTIASNKEAINKTIVDLHWPYFPNDTFPFLENRAFTSWFTFILMQAEMRAASQTMILKAHKASSMHLLGIDKRAPINGGADADSAPPIDVERNRNNLEEFALGANDTVIVPIPSYSLTEKKRNYMDIGLTLLTNDSDSWTALIARSQNIWEMRFPETYNMSVFVLNAGTRLYVHRFPYYPLECNFEKITMDIPVYSSYASVYSREIDETDIKILNTSHHVN